ERGDLLVGRAEIDGDAPIGLEQDAEAARVQVEGHGKIRGVRVSGHLTQLAAAADALLADEEIEGLAAVVRPVVLLAEAVKRAALVAAKRELEGVGVSRLELEREPRAIGAVRADVHREPSPALGGVLDAHDVSIE